MIYKETEEQFLSWVIAYAQLKKWLVSHQRPAMTFTGYRTAIQGDQGFPDLVLARDSRVILAELKSEGGTLSPYQEKWQEELKNFNEYYVWRPSDREEIERILV